MALQLRRIRPWDNGSPFHPDFRQLINEMGEAVYRYEEIETELIRVIMTPLESGDEGVPAQASFPVIIQGTLSNDWPKEYDWVESELVGSGQGTIEGVLAGGNNSTDEDDDGNLLFGLGINKVELIPGFGETVGPYGQRITSFLTRITVLAIAPGSPATMVLRKNASGITIPVFEAYNPITVECNVPPGVPPDIAG